MTKENGGVFFSCFRKGKLDNRIKTFLGECLGYSHPVLCPSLGLVCRYPQSSSGASGGSCPPSPCSIRAQQWAQAPDLQGRAQTDACLLPRPPTSKDPGTAFFPTRAQQWGCALLHAMALTGCGFSKASLAPEQGRAQGNGVCMAGHGHSPPLCTDRLWAVRAALGTQDISRGKDSFGGARMCDGDLSGGSMEPSSLPGAWRRECSGRGVGTTGSPALICMCAKQGIFHQQAALLKFLHGDLCPQPGWEPTAADKCHYGALLPLELWALPPHPGTASSVQNKQDPPDQGLLAPSHWASAGPVPPVPPAHPAASPWCCPSPAGRAELWHRLCAA